MSQIHRRFSDQQVKVLLQRYCPGQLRRTDAQDLLDTAHIPLAPIRVSPGTADEIKGFCLVEGDADVCYNPTGGISRRPARSARVHADPWCLRVRLG